MGISWELVRNAASQAPPGPESESAFSQDSRWFRVLNSLSLISPVCETGLVKPTRQIHLLLNKITSVEIWF
jgi:hypothetical protein